MKSTLLEIVKGSTFKTIVRWESEPLLYKAITGVTKSAPVALTVVGHGLKSGWRFAVESVQGMTKINSSTPSDPDTWFEATVVDADHIEINNVNSLDYTAYTAGGVIKFYTPTDMTSYTARMKVKDRIGGATLLSLTSLAGDIVIDNVTRTITITIDPAETSPLTPKKGVYDLELVSVSGQVFNVMSGPITFVDEVTT